jgi:hypothetical protein
MWLLNHGHAGPHEPLTIPSGWRIHSPFTPAQYFRRMQDFRRMHAAEQRSEDARMALEIVEGDPAARQRLVSAFAADGDPVAELRNRAAGIPHEQSDEERAQANEEQRILFGRPQGDSDAFEAQRAIIAGREQHAQQDAALDAAVRAVLDAVVQHPLEVGEVTPETAATGTGNTTARRRTAWIALALVGCFALGVVVAAQFSHPGQPASPTPLVAASQPAIGSGSPAAAQRWLAIPQADAPRFPYAGDLRTLGVAAGSIRFIQTDLSGASLWIGRTSQDFCLLLTNPPSATKQDPATVTTTCGTPVAITHSPLSISTGAYQYTWDGQSISVRMRAGGSSGD